MLRAYRERKNRNPALTALLYLPSRDLVARDRVCVFHHIPKCAGTSVVNALGRWFVLKEDYRTSVDGCWCPKKRVNLQRLRNRHCLAGHFDYPGVYLRDRYPEIFTDPRYYLFTFVRDPLAAKLSLYWYEQKHNVLPTMTIAEHLLSRDNYIAQCFPCTPDQMGKTLDRYDFVGVTEHMDESFVQLAERLHRKPLPVAHLNALPNEDQDLPRGLINAFRRRNELDYRIYDYAVKRLFG